MNGPALFILNFAIFSAIIVGVAALTTLLFGKKLRAKSRYILWVIVLLRLCVPFSLNMLPVSPVERLPEPSFLNSVTERPEPSHPAADAAFLPSPDPVTSSPVIGTDTPSSINGEATDENVSAPRAGQPSAAVEQNTEINENGEPFLKKAARAAVKALPYLIVFVSAVALSVRLIGYTVYSKRFGKTLRDPDERESAVYYGVCSRVGITSPPELKKSKSEHSPMLLGFFRPRIVLPDVGYTEEELKTILTHEIIHYNRKDHLLSLASAFVLSLLWFDPFAYLAVRFYRREAEISCDEASTNGEYGLEKEEYGASLLSVIQKTACGKKHASTDLFSGKSELKKRFEAIASKTAKKKGYALLAACLVLSSLLGVFVGCEKDNAHDADDYTEDGVRFVNASALYGEEEDGILPFDSFFVKNTFPYIVSCGRTFCEYDSLDGLLKTTYGELCGLGLKRSGVRPFPEQNASAISFIRTSGNGEQQTYEFVFASDEPSPDDVPSGTFVSVATLHGYYSVNKRKTESFSSGDRAEDHPILSSYRWASAGYDKVRGQYRLRSYTTGSGYIPVRLTFYIKSERPADQGADIETYTASLREFVDSPEGEITCILAERITDTEELSDRQLCSMAFINIQHLYSICRCASLDISVNHPDLLFNTNLLSRDNDNAENVYYPLKIKDGDEKKIVKAVKVSEYLDDPGKYAGYYVNSSEIMYADDNGSLLEETLSHLDTVFDRDLYYDVFSEHFKHVEVEGKEYLYYTPDLRSYDHFSDKYGSELKVISRSEKEAVIAYTLRPQYYSEHGYDTEELRFRLNADSVVLEKKTEKHEGRYDELFFFKNLDREQEAKASDGLLTSPESEDGKYEVLVSLKNPDDPSFLSRHGLDDREFGPGNSVLTLDLDQIKDILNDSNVKFMQLKTEYDKFLDNLRKA